MDANPYLIEKIYSAYQQRRLKEAEYSRLLREIRPPVIAKPFWRPLALVIAAVLISTGRRLQNAAELPPQLAHKTC
jgi:hypothetical protein